ncbi:FG-GAP-like repeat-containing protein [Spartinivicinus ruber]|uniref:FG-GAP-like repeat-containing protein n=1 Tax=Spartinivicinus ruber TaxID=2683272 RepID=UPI0013D69919|nr:FG-GAP-like repeat-containing protein [Spartinivicinus ruber]
MPRLSQAFNDLKILLPNGKLQSLPDPSGKGVILLSAYHSIIDQHSVDNSSYVIDRQPDSLIRITAPNGETIYIQAEQVHDQENLITEAIEQHQVIYTSSLSSDKLQALANVIRSLPSAIDSQGRISVKKTTSADEDSDNDAGYQLPTPVPRKLTYSSIQQEVNAIQQPFHGQSPVTHPPLIMVPSVSHDLKLDKAIFFQTLLPPTTVTIATKTVTVLEGTSQPGQLIVDLGVVNNTGKAISFTYAVSGTATPGSDYQALTGIVAIEPGQRTATINVQVLDDERFEASETIQLQLTGSSHLAVTINSTPAVFTLVDDEAMLDLDADDSTAVGNNFTNTFTEVGTGGPSVAIADTDVNIPFDGNLTGAVITLANPQAGDLLLDSTAGGLPGGITASAFTNGIMTLSGTASAADYADALALIHYQNTGDDPNIGGTALTRTITVAVTNGVGTSNVATSTIIIAAENDTPAITVGGFSNITGQLPAFGGENTISTTQDNVFGIIAADIDGDGDLDAIASAQNDTTIAWFENTDGLGTFGPENIISNTRGGVERLTSADIDGDGDLDVIFAGRGDDTVGWFENTDGLGTFGPENVINNAQDSVQNAVAADIDGDGDLDVVTASNLDDTIAWFENTDGLGTFGPENTISNTQDGAENVTIGDVDGDGDLDVVTASTLDDTIAWFENTDGLGTFGPENIINNAQDGARWVTTADIDGDGDLDVITTADNAFAFQPGVIAWFENTDGLGTFGPENTIDTTFTLYLNALAEDIDGDGDLDVIVPDFSSDRVVWFENTDGAGGFGPKNVIGINLDGANTVAAADFDGDGDLDIGSSSHFDDRIAWFENQSIDSTTPNTPLTFSAVNGNAIVVSDPDAGSLLTASLTVTNGILNVTASGTAVVTNNGTAAISIMGSVADVNATLEGAVYTPNLNYLTTQANPEALTVTITDNGNAGTGGVMMDTETINIRVAPTIPPVVIDLDGDGVEFISLQTPYQFDVTGDGQANYTAWAGADDAILVYDRNGDGQVSSPLEFQFTHYLEGATTDLAGLHYFDTNNNQQLDSSDEAFSAFHLWQDRNLNGQVDTGEWNALGDDYISINLISDETSYVTAAGSVMVHGTTQVMHHDGSITEAADVSFQYLANDIPATTGEATVYGKNVDPILVDDPGLFPSGNIIKSSELESSETMDILQPMNANTAQAVLSIEDVLASDVHSFDSLLGLSESQPLMESVYQPLSYTDVYSLQYIEPLVNLNVSLLVSDFICVEELYSLNA